MSSASQITYMWIVTVLRSICLFHIYRSTFSFYSTGVVVFRDFDVMAFSIQRIFSLANQSSKRESIRMNREKETIYCPVYLRGAYVWCTYARLP